MPNRPENGSLPKLRVNRAQAEQQVRDRMDKGQELLVRLDALLGHPIFRPTSQTERWNADYQKWDDFNVELLRRLFDSPTIAHKYAYGPTAATVLPGGHILEGSRDFLTHSLTKLESILERLPLYDEWEAVAAPSSTVAPKQTQSKTVFVVHGHDAARREAVSGFLRKLGLIPIILHEQSSGGDTLIEKVERYSDVDYVIVLVTPDDLGGSTLEPSKLQARARQNVIFEHGYLFGRLGRRRVCALYVKGVELPSDMHGIVYIEFSEGEGWQFRLARELKDAGLDIDLPSLLGTNDRRRAQDSTIAQAEVSKRLEAHLAHLKEELFRPMLVYLIENVMPILGQQCGNVGIERKVASRPSAGLLDDARTFTERFCFRRTVEPQIDPSLYPSEHVTVDAPWEEGALYDDARQNHFHDFVQSWEDFLRPFESYNKSCMKYAEALKSEILQASSLPELDIGERQPRWIYATSLALVIFYRQLGLDTIQFGRVPEGNIERLTYKRAYTLVQGATTEIDQCIAKADALLRRRNSIDSVISQAHNLEEDAFKLKRQIEGLLATQMLSGECSYIK